MTLLVPYRDREEHLKEFVPAMRHHDIYIIEQADTKPFNRGKLINVGYLETKPFEFVVNDIDMITRFFPAALFHGVVQCGTSNIQTMHYLGGSTLFTSFSFSEAQGYHNDFWHRAEDNEMMFNLRRKGIPIMYMPQTFVFLPHERTGPEFIPELWQKAQAPRTKDMLKTCEYKLISKELKDGYTHLKVEL